MKTRHFPWSHTLSACLLACAAVAACLLGAAILSGCEFTSTTGGSETTNGLTGRIQDGEGKPIAHAPVVLVPADFMPVPGKDTRTPVATRTDANGRYRFSTVAAGTYDLESRDSTRGLKAWLPGLRIDADQTSALTVDGTLKVTGTLKIPFAGRHLPENAILFVPGSSFAISIVGKLDDKGFLTVSGLPEGDYPVLMAYFPDTSDGAPIAVAEAFHITSGDTARPSAFAAWAHSRTLRFDLGANGADVATAASSRGSAGNAGYPLLVRLRAPEFDFSQARSGGEDIRFARADGALLPFQIERWDAAAGEAIAWIRLDDPKSGPDSLLVYWGRKDARDLGEAARVFDTAQGLRAAWHLGESAQAAAGGYRDATLSAWHASATPSPAVGAAASAVVGLGKGFAESDTGQMSAPLPAAWGGNAAFTITFWMKFSMSSKRIGVLALGEESPLRGFHFLVRPDTTAQFGPWDSTPDAEPSAQQNHFSLAPYLGTWAHVATVYDPRSQLLRTWINGALAAENTLASLDLHPGAGIRFGHAIHKGISGPGEANLEGALDEVRVYGRALDAAEIKLDYATQRQDAAIVEWH